MSGRLFEEVARERNVRWTVVRVGGWNEWIAASPKDVRDNRFFPPGAHSKALAYANTQARAAMPTAAQIDQAEAAQDAELDALVADLAAWDEANVNDALRRRP